MDSSTLKILNKAIKETNGNEFKVLYYILNGKALGVAKFYKDVLAGELNITPRQIALITDSLAKKGYIVKERNSKGSIYYFKPTTEKKEVDKNTYYEDLKDKKWLRKRLQVLLKYGRKCALCGSSENIDVHHLSYEKGKRAWEYPIENFVPLCRECHKKVHGDKNHKFYPKFLS